MSVVLRIGLVLPVAWAGVSAHAQVVKLNAPLASELLRGRLSDYQFTPDGTRAVYRSDAEQEGVFELFSRPLDGSAPPLRLNEPMHPQGDVGVNGTLPDSFAIGAQGRVVYFADEAVENVAELFSVPADGSAARIRISTPGDNVAFVQLDATRTRAFFQNGSFLGTVGPLKVVPVDGSAPALTLTPGLNVRRFWPTPDGSGVVCAAAAGNGQELYLVPADGSAPPQLLTSTHPVPSGLVDFEDLVFTANGARIVFNEVEDPFDDPIPTTYSLPLDLSQPKTLIAGQPLYPGVFTLVPGAIPERVAFQQGSHVASTATDGSLFATLSPPGSVFSSIQAAGADVLFVKHSPGTILYRAPADGSLAASALFTGPSAMGPVVLASPTEVAFVVYFGSAKQLHSVPLAGGAALPLHPLPPGSQGPSVLLAHPDGQRVLFSGDLETAGKSELYVVPLDASLPPAKLNPAMDPGLSAFDLKLTPDATRVGFRIGATLAPDDLFLAPVDGSTPSIQLSESHLGTRVVGDVLQCYVTPAGTRLAYRADLDADQDFDFIALDASLVPHRLGDGSGSALSDFAFTPDGGRAVFQTEGSGFRLRVAALADGTAIALDTSPQAFDSPFGFDPGSTRVAYLHTAGPAQQELRSVALDGLSPAVVLHGPLAAGMTVSDFRVGAGGTVVFVANLAQAGTRELWAAPIAGGAPPLRLNPTLVAGGGVQEVELDSSGTLAVFRVDARVDNRFELFVVPVDDSLPARRLNGPLPSGGDVLEFELAPDGRRVVYRANQVTSQRFDLFSVTLAPPHGTSAGALRPRRVLLSRLPQGRSVQADWHIAPDGRAVVYRANPNDVEVLELLRVPVDGSAAPVALSGVLPAFADVFSFDIAPDQSRVAFQADSRLDDVRELFSVPFAGGAVVPLDTLPAFAAVVTYAIDPSSRDLVFTADREVDGVTELYRVPLDGSLPIRRQNRPLVPGGSVQPDFVALPLGTVYRADQQHDEVVELYFAF